MRLQHHHINLASHVRVRSASALRAAGRLSLKQPPQRARPHIQVPHPPNVTMSSQRSSVVPQDFLARIRYSNALPPPPCPPKLLDIPNTGLSSGQYTSASFASRLAREQPLNIEADAELGMPIDLVGIPKVFDGDESGKRANSAPARKRATATDALVSYTRHGSPATAIPCRSCAHATT